MMCERAIASAASRESASTNTSTLAPARSAALDAPEVGTAEKTKRCIDMESLRKAVKHRMVDLDLDRPGSMIAMSRNLSEHLGRPVNRNCLVMALTGYRSGPAAQELLRGLHDMLFAP